MKLRGIFPIVATPFAADGSIDETGLRRVVRFCLDCGVHGLVWPAVASEFYSLADDERKRFLRVVIDETGGRVPVVAGVSGCSVPVAAGFAEDAADLQLETLSSELARDCKIVDGDAIRFHTTAPQGNLESDKGSRLRIADMKPKKGRCCTE